jgi:DNA repair exonuclease SbcCD nuclease subunit
MADDAIGRGELLCVGDVHLGRRPGRVPADLEAQGLDPRALAPRAAFEAVVEEALERRVCAVLFAGDVVDAEVHFLEAYSVLERGVRRLEQAGIEAIAVAGNHDVRALPRLADEVAGFRLLGRGGRWEEHLLQGHDGAPLARVVGWSFPRARVPESPLGGLPALGLAPRADVPTLGLLHCDLDHSGGPYAPVARGELEAVRAVDAWLLGHVHAPSHDALAAPRPIGYLGSLCGLDPGETGVHGPWSLALEGGRGLRLEQLALAPLAWAALDVPVDGLAGAEGLEPALTGALREFAESEGGRFGAARALGCRLRLVGRSRAHRDLALRAAGLELERLSLERAGRVFFVDKLVDAARAALDLDELAAGGDPPGLLARKLQALERDDPEGRRQVRAAREHLQTLVGRPPWVALEGGALDDEVVRAHLVRAGEQALEGLLAQRGDLLAQRGDLLAQRGDLLAQQGDRA